MAVLSVGCATVGHDQIRLAPTGFEPDEAIALVLNDLSAESEYSTGLEKKVVRCIRNAFWQHPELRMVSSDEFRNAAFPNLMPEDVPPRPWEQVVAEVTFRERIAPLGVRYLIAAVVSTEKKSGAIATGAAGDGVAFGALGWKWDHSSWIKADVVDLTNARLAGSVRATADGRSGVGLAIVVAGGYGGGGALPIPFVYFSFPQWRACQEFGEGVAEFLTGESPGDSEHEQTIDTSP